jgi:hypothetical protein
MGDLWRDVYRSKPFQSDRLLSFLMVVSLKMNLSGLQRKVK